MEKLFPHETGKFISINSDGKGYYAYLPAIFIADNISEITENKAFTNRVGEKNVIKYPPGTAILQTPFFAGALWYNQLTEKTTLGDEAPFQIAVQIASIFYLLLGLWFTNQFLTSFKLKPGSILIALSIIFLGTNLLYYTLFRPSMSHVYSFSAIAGFACFVQKYFLEKKLKWLLLATIAISIIVLIRPFNLIVLLIIPFLTTGISDLKLQLKYLYQEPKWLFLVILTGVMLISIQPLLWYIQTGHWILWSYKDEGFYFLYPQIFNVLFSFKRGLFVYAPVLLLTLPGFYFLRRHNRWQSLWLAGFVLILIYLVSSWWNWYYGDGFGHRAFIDYFVFFALLIAFTIDKCEKVFWKVLLALFLVFTVALNLIQTYQYRIGIMHPHSMNAEKYKYVFLKTSSDFIHSIGGNSDVKPYSESVPQIYLETKNGFESEKENWEVSNRSLSSIAKNSKNHVVKFSGNEYGLKFSLPYVVKAATCRKLWAEVQLTRIDLSPQSSDGTLLVVQKQNVSGENLYYYAFPINDIPSQHTGQLDTFNYSFGMPCLNNENELLNIYLWNQKRGTFEIDEVSIAIYLFN